MDVDPQTQPVSAQSVLVTYVASYLAVSIRGKQARELKDVRHKLTLLPLRKLPDTLPNNSTDPLLSPSPSLELLTLGF